MGGKEDRNDQKVRLENDVIGNCKMKLLYYIFLQFIDVTKIGEKQKKSWTIWGFLFVQMHHNNFQVRYMYVIFRGILYISIIRLKIIQMVLRMDASNHCLRPFEFRIVPRLK
jgi:hypothetical protein